MKKRILYAGFMLTGLLFVSCGGNKQTEDTAEDVELVLEEPAEALNALDPVAEQHSYSSADWDKILDDYERYVDKYLALVKKLNKGDKSVMSDYLDILESAESLSSRLETANEMTSAQMARYTRIVKKMASASANISNSAFNNIDSWLDDDDDDDDDDDWF